MTYINFFEFFLIGSFLVQLFYLFYFNSRLLISNEKHIDSFNPNISVIICARNEEKNLKDNLEKFLNQDYDNYEVIVVNDRSWDNSLEYLNNLKTKYLKLKVVDIPDNKTDHFGKKLAITLGIKAAKNNYLLFTDADCFPYTNSWISQMSSGFHNKKEIVLGAGIYAKERGFLNKIIRYDTAQIATNYLSFAKAKITYMGVGRNLGYTQDLYYLNEGFKSHYHIASGDDDLFVNQASKNDNSEIVFSKESVTISLPKKKWKDWVIQKRRHHTTNNKYKTSHKFILGIQYLSSLLFNLSFLILLISDFSKIEISLLFGLRYLVIICLFYKPFKILMCKDLLWSFPIYEIILLICQPIFQMNKKNRI
tara:strand:- start:2169 stop:3263 length:1095 start_codon:yes stop_codon:yes gene_type:complete